MLPGGKDPVTANQSMLNPTDAMNMAAGGDVTSQMTVRDFMAKLGIDVDGPVTQLQQFAQRQTENAGGMSKMRNIAQAAGPSAPPAPGAGQPAETPDMGRLLGALG